MTDSDTAGARRFFYTQFSRVWPAGSSIASSIQTSQHSCRMIWVCLGPLSAIRRVLWLVVLVVLVERVVTLSRDILPRNNRYYRSTEMGRVPRRRVLTRSRSQPWRRWRRYIRRRCTRDCVAPQVLHICQVSGGTLGTTFSTLLRFFPRHGPNT